MEIAIVTASYKIMIDDHQVGLVPPHYSRLLLSN